MDCLYETFTVFSFDEYKKFVDATSKRKQSNILLAVVSLFLIIVGIVQKTPIMFVLAVIYPVLMLFSQKKGMERD